MAYIVLTITGVLSVILVNKDWQRRKQIIFIGAVILLGALAYLAIEIIALKSEGGISKGVEDIIAALPWSEIGMYFAMVAGMTSKYMFDAIGNRKRGRIKLYKWQLIKPILVSPIIFAGIYSQLPENTATFMLLLFSYQNGFFWQTLLYKVFPDAEKKKND